MSDVRLPSVFGPGNWYRIHRVGRDSTTQEQQHKGIEETVRIVIQLPCSDCSDHGGTYLSADSWHKHIGKSLLGQPPELTLFILGWLMHNDVNKRLGKPLITLEQALELYPLEVHSKPGCNQRCQRDLEQSTVSHHN